jgi:tRNA-2-methylthio-N6-dimethylallyladenosine synthase
VSGERVARGSETHAWLPIIYGCDKTCTYCIVPFSRGPERSRPFDDVLTEARALAAAGYQDVTLLGQNVNSYGHDLAPDPRFADVQASRHLGRDLPLDGRPDIAALLRAIDGLRTPDGAPAIPRLRFITSHPWDLGERLIAAMAESSSVCEHLHLPVQSGDDAVLRRMGRQYTTEAYLRLVERLREAIPGIALTTDVIVGFCGETLAQHETTLALLREVRYDAVFAASFSPRPGTPAAKLPDDVPSAEKRRRLNELLDMQEAISRERNEAWVGRTTEVLFDELRPPRAHHDHEETDGEGSDGAPARSPAVRGPQLTGRNRENKLVHAVGDPELLGRRVPVTIERAGPYALVGRIAGAPAE